MSNPDALEGLAEKLAAANLSDDEASLLTTLLRGEAGNDVEGFGAGGRPDAAGIKLGDKTIDPTSQKHWIDCSSLQFKMGI